jgi:hypothetical protein
VIKETFVDDASPDVLMRAIVTVFRRWLEQGKKPGSDLLMTSTRQHRPALVREIEEEWNSICGSRYEDDLFPFHESYVVRKWITFRKLNDSEKVQYYALLDNKG